MRIVALEDAATKLSDLVREVEETGEEVVLTRGGEFAARLVPRQLETGPVAQERRIAMRRLRELQQQLIAEGRGLQPEDWETLKAEARNEDKDWAR